ncbi:MAG: transketolase [Firmicutes bacterium]|nr:transketolase [Bacillota bacterium]
MIGNFEDPRKTFGKAVTDIALQDERVVLLSADSGKSSGFGDFIKASPDRYFEFGIMEQQVVGVASGLATTGKIPVFCAIAPFVTARPFEMFRNDLGYMKQNAKIVGRNGGITYSDLGSTHHSLDDYALMKMIPGVVIIDPQDPNEIRSAVKAMIDYVGPVYMRIGNSAMPNIFEEEPFVIGKGRKVTEGTDVTIVSTGSVTAAVLQANELLKANGISAEIIGLPTICPLDEELILASVEKTGKIVTVEENYVYGGIGTMISDLLCREYPRKVLKLGVPHDYATNGPYNEILAKYGLDAAGIAASVTGFIK